MTVDYNKPPSPEVPEANGNASFFWPILVLIIGMLISAGYQVVAMQQQVDALKQEAEQAQVDTKFKQAQYQKAKLYKLASDVLQLAPTDPNAKQIVTDYKIEQRAPASGATPGTPPGN